MASSGGTGVFGHGYNMFGAAAAATSPQPPLVIPSAMDDALNRHGSAEQDTRGRANYLNSMSDNCNTPRSTSPRTPRNPRARSQPTPDDDYEDRRRDRAE